MRTIIQNRKATFEYFLEDSYTCGIKLHGSEVRMLKDGHASINESSCFCYIDKTLNTVVLSGMYVKPNKLANTYDRVEPIRDRPLLITKEELKKIQKKIDQKGYTVVPVRVLETKTGLVKVEICIAKGKKLYDKRDTIKKRDQERYG